MFSASNANWFAYIILVAYVPIGIVLFRWLPPARAALFLVLAGVLFLPEMVSIDLPLLPRLGKESMIYISMSAGLVIVRPEILRRFPPGRGLEILILVMLLGSIATVLLNTDTLHYGPRVVPGMAPYEAFTSTILELLRYGLPFYLGRILFRSSRDLEDILKALIIAGVVYTCFMAVEMRLSPQMHRWTYGFHPNNFGAAKRWGGYRPMVYMDSGIAVAIFMVNSVMASLIGIRARLSLYSVSTKIIAPYLLAFLMMSKSVASMVWGVLFSPVLLLLSPRKMAALAVLLAFLVASYPFLRLANLFPWQEIVAAAESIDPERAASLNYRFENDENMLAKTRERPIFGWGGWSRNWAYDETTGRHLTVPDGAWIIRLSSYGFVGFYALYGLYVLPVFFGYRSLSRIRGERNRAMMAGLMLIVIIRAVDQLPNGLYSSYPIFLAGALYNLTPRLSAKRATGRSAPARRQKGATRAPIGHHEDKESVKPDLLASKPQGASAAELLGVRRGSDSPSDR